MAGGTLEILCFLEKESNNQICLQPIEHCKQITTKQKTATNIHRSVYRVAFAALPLIGDESLSTHECEYSTQSEDEWRDGKSFRGYVFMLKHAVSPLHHSGDGTFFLTRGLKVKKLKFYK